MAVDVLRALVVGCAVLLVFGWLEYWPRRMPKWLPRTVLRLIGITLVIPLSAGFAFGITGGGTGHDFGLLTVVALLFAPWIAVWLKRSRTNPLTPTASPTLTRSEAPVNTKMPSDVNGSASASGSWM